jgi:VWFA-related protein
VHDGDLFGVVSSGPSSISIDMTYDKRRLDDAIKKIHGDGLKPSEIITAGSGDSGPRELRHRAHVAFSTMLEGLRNLERVHNRRKAIVWVSEGYDFNPFQESRFGLREANSPFLQNPLNAMQNQQLNPDGGSSSSRMPGGLAAQQMQNETFSDADLTMELAEITRAANRANTTIYTIDPRGLVAGSDIDEQVDPGEWNNYVRKSQDTLRVIAEDTGGLAVVNQNDFDKALKRIDAESSDYYVLGYYSSNPDPSHRRRKIEVRVKRSDVNLVHRTEYVVKPPPPAAPATPRP